MTTVQFAENFELKFEITEKCNSNCSFCHQGYGKNNSHRELTFALFKERLIWAENLGIRSVRFTGGEPTLNKDLKRMVEIAFKRGFYVTVNTNGLVAANFYSKLAPYVNMYKISLPAASSNGVDSLTGVNGSFLKKISAISQCLEIGTEIQILTVIIEQNIGQLEEFLIFADNIPQLKWVPLRVESSSYCKRPISRIKMQELAEELNRLMEKYPGKVDRLGLATPFCSVSPVELGAKVFMGRADDCGPFHSLTITPDNELIACYSCRTPMTHFHDLKQLTADKEYNRLTQKTGLPKMCKTCKYVDRCMGGCLAPDTIVKYDGGWVDYLAVP
jgi:radical SAM protein with 4Fe4S-binding SPASM domain